MSSWAKFYEGHGKAHYTPVFNTFLDAQISDKALDLKARVLAWVLRNSWGRHSDEVIDAEGTRQSQVDCARALEVLNKTGKPDRKKINPVFQELERICLIRFEGRDIFPIDDPALFASSSPNVVPLSDIYEEKAKKSLDYFIEQVWRVRNPKAFEEYQIVESRFKTVRSEYNELRTKLLSEFKTYGQEDDSEMSERGPTLAEECREGVRHDVGKGSDIQSGRGPTSPEPILNNFLNGEHLNIVSTAEQAFAYQSETTRWKGLLHAADLAKMDAPNGQHPAIRAHWNRLKPGEQFFAIEGIRLRMDAEQYGDPAFTPGLLRYLKDQKWTGHIRDKRGKATSRPDRKAAAREEFSRRLMEEAQEQEVRHANGRQLHD